jgi:hypothetical protein
MENFEFKSQIKERINKYKNLETPEEKAKYFKEMMIEFEDVEIQKYILEEKQRLEKMRRFGRKTEKNPDGSVQLSFYDLKSSGGYNCSQVGKYNMSTLWRRITGNGLYRD